MGDGRTARTRILIAAVAMLASAIAAVAAEPTPPGPPLDPDAHSPAPGPSPFGLNGPSLRLPPTKPDGPAAPSPQADATAPPRERVLDDLFQRLRKSNDTVEAHGIAGAIERVWARSGSDTADLLMRRAVTAMGSKNLPLAQELLDKVVVLEPDWAEGWNKRATARYLADDARGAMGDIAHVLSIEPRHFAALAGMGLILRQAGDNKGALQVLRRALEIYPEFEGLKAMVDKLSTDVEGRDI